MCFRNAQQIPVAVAQGLLDLAKEVSPRRPYGTTEIISGNRLPTLKRGANKPCAYGAAIRGAGVEGGGLCWAHWLGALAMVSTNRPPAAISG